MKSGLKRMISWAARYARDFGERFLPWKVYDVLHVEDLPNHLAKRTVYIVGEPNYPLHASMACPRGRCGIVLNMNLAPDDEPRWILRMDARDRPTLNPSVWRTEDCGCHFVLRAGRITWC